MRAIAEEAGVALRTAQRWVTQYRRSGLAGLVRKPREDRGGRRVVSQRIREAVEGLALEKPPLTIASLYRQVRLFAETIGEPLPSYWIVYDLVRSMPAALVTLAHEGAKTYSERFDLVHRREASHANAVWQCDHAQLDILLLRQDGPPARPWLTIAPGLAGEVVTLREIVRARNGRRRELRTTIKSRQAVVDALLELRRGQVSEETHAKPAASAKSTAPALKRYRNE